jgi:hypothetical protein
MILQFYRSQNWGEDRRKERRSKELNSESEWRKVSPTFSMKSTSKWSFLVQGCRQAEEQD